MGFPHQEDCPAGAGGRLPGQAASASTLEVSRQRPDYGHLSGMLGKDAEGGLQDPPGRPFLRSQGHPG